MSTREATRGVFPAPEPDYAPPPGETLRELLDEQGKSQAELARRTGLSPKHVNQLIQGVVPLSADVAARLELVTGVPAKFWNRLEADYQSIMVRKRQRGAFEEAAEWLADMPVSDLVKRDVLPEKPKDKVSRVEQLFAFFGVASVDAWNDVYATPHVSFRKSKTTDVLPGAVATWMRLGELAARDIPTATYDEVRLRGALTEFRSLTRRPVQEFAPRLRELCGSAGVALVIVPEIKGTRSYGCTRWLSSDKAMIQLSCRYRSDDQFWFTLFHECAHLILHGKRAVWIEGSEVHDPAEAEADAFASDQLIPRKYAVRLRALKSKESVKAFADEVGVSAGVVIGRLQHDNLWRQSDGNQLKQRFSAEDLQVVA